MQAQTQNNVRRRPTLRLPHPGLAYAVEGERFATFACARAYAAFRAEESGQEVAIAKFGVVVEYVP